MATLFLEGWDHLSSTAALRRFALAGGLTHYDYGGRNNGGHLGLAGSNTATILAKSSGTTMIFGFALRFQNLGYSFFVRFRTLNGITARLEINPVANTFVLTRGDGTTVLATGVPASISYSTWNYIEVLLTNDGTTGTFEVLLNGAAVATYTGNTAGVAGNPNAVILVLTNGAASVDFDDMYITDGTGGYWGDVDVRAMLPSAAGANTGWTGTGTPWQDIGEVIPEDSTYISSTVSTTKSTFPFKRLISLAVPNAVTLTVSGTYQTNLAANAIDIPTRAAGPTATSWTSNTAGSTNPWLQMDMGVTTTVDIFRLLQPTGTADYASGWKLQGSADAVSWTDLYTTTTSTGGDSGYIRLSSPASYRYYRFFATAGATTRWSIHWAQLFNYGTLPSGTVKALSIASEIQSGTGPGRVQMIARVSGTDYTTGSAVDMAGGTAASLAVITETSPATSTAWTVSEINGAEFGPRQEA